MPNIVVLTIPAVGHINPCVTLANLLIPHGFTFTIVITEELAASLPSLAANQEEEDKEGELAQQLDGHSRAPIRYVSVPGTTSLAQRPPDMFPFVQLLEAMRSMRSGFEDLLPSLLLGPEPISCIIADCFLWWAAEVGQHFDIPTFIFFTSNSHAVSAFLHIDELIARGASPVSDPQQMIDFIPSLPPMRAADLPQSIRTNPSFVLDAKKNMTNAAGLILNTVYELERKPLDLTSKTIPVYPIGPMLRMSSSTGRNLGEGTITTRTEDRGCLTWLGKIGRVPSSVLFVSFGSMADSSADQLKEIAEGLEASGQPFLWVIRSDIAEVHPLSSVLPEGFMERTKGRGLIISWAPQLEVLSHPSVGGFLTHCGWNSITENLSTGCVPMLCWPQIAEQRLNARILVDEWRVGLDIEVPRRNGENIVKSSTIERAVVELMQGDKGKEIKKRILVLKEVVSQSVQEGGSSPRYLRSLVEDLRNASQILETRKKT